MQVSQPSVSRGSFLRFFFLPRGAGHGISQIFGGGGRGVVLYMCFISGLKGKVEMVGCVAKYRMSFEGAMVVPKAGGGVMCIYCCCCCRAFFSGRSGNYLSPR